MTYLLPDSTACYSPESVNNDENDSFYANGHMTPYDGLEAMPSSQDDICHNFGGEIEDLFAYQNENS